MLLRKKPLRGEKYRLKNGEEVTALESIGKDSVRVLQANGVLIAVSKKDLELPVINTEFYEKVHEF